MIETAPRGPRPDGVARPSFEEAQRLALACGAAMPAEHLPLAAAAGRVLAGDVVAEADLVPFARSAMDGFAVRVADLMAGSGYSDVSRFSLALAAPIFAERGAAVLVPGTASPIATGAPLPRGADAVVPVEAVESRAGRVSGPAAIAPGDHIFPAGDDARAGDRLARRGERLAPARMALLAANGTATVVVARRPCVAVLTTGTEIVAVDARPAAGQIRNSNATLLVATLAAAGAAIVSVRHVPDDDEALCEALARALRESDLVVTTGGASVGTRDAVKATLAALGVVPAFASVALRPAKPTGFGRLGDVAVATLPGNPAAAFVALHEFVIPALAAMQGAESPRPPRARARLSGTLRAKGERTFAAFAALALDRDGRLVATPLGEQCSSLTRIAATAAGLIVVPPGDAVLRMGEIVDVDVLDWQLLTCDRR